MSLTARATMRVVGKTYDESEGIARAIIDDTLQSLAQYVNANVIAAEDRFVLFGAIEGFARDQLDTEWQIKGVPKWDGVLSSKR